MELVLIPLLSGTGTSLLAYLLMSARQPVSEGSLEPPGPVKGN